MSKTILIIGGTGLIGSTIHKIISKRNPNLKIIIGTRKKTKENQVQFNIDNLKTFELLKNLKIDLIIACVKDSKNNILNYAINHKIDYIDITKPTPELEIAHQITKNKFLECKIVFSSGWMSGITPLLVYSSGIKQNEINNIKIIIYYSTKDKAGDSSADFMAQNVSKPFFVYQNNNEIKTKHFLDIEKHTFSFDNQTRKVFDFDIPDIYIFNKIEKIPSVRAKLTFNSKIITSVLSIMQKISFFKILNFTEKKLIFGGSGNGDISTFEIIYLNQKLTQQKITLKCTKGQSELTAFSTVLHVEKMLENTTLNNVYFSHQLHHPKQFISSLISNNSISIK